MILSLLIPLAGCAPFAWRQSATEDGAISVGSLPPGWTAPRPLHTVAPAYPADLWRAGIEGTVWLNCLIDERGAVRDVKVKDAIATDFAWSALDRPASRATRVNSHTPGLEFVWPTLAVIGQWTFAPATHDGAPVSMWVHVPIHFRVRAVVSEPEP